MKYKIRRVGKYAFSEGIECIEGNSIRFSSKIHVEWIRAINNELVITVVEKFKIEKFLEKGVYYIKTEVEK